MSAKLDNKVALVTGGGRGIGRAICLALADAGAHVVAAARTTEEIDAVAKEITDAGGMATAVTADIANEDDVVALFDHVRDVHGRLDVLVNNAGIGIYGPVVGFSASAIDRIMAVNVRGTFLCCREAMKLMIARREGYIINISSVVGFRGYPNQAAYTAAKHAVMGLTKSLAAEAQEHGIRVSAILPGGVDTQMIRRSRPDLDVSALMHPEDIAQSVMYLLSLSERAAVDEIYIRRLDSKPF
ncbi:MAG: SDR family oxidoreductase [Planctomycetes bacterium]|nr:SDR family oxidoreductase [Planctomycetota bacterium]